ncbi:hypothetical protein FACS1894204_05680 [Synergistales bacterium]|nr:hypothetical protein FACS1894204_05680 [Synergistales bacterium]
MKLKIFGFALWSAAMAIISLVLYAGYETTAAKNQSQEITRKISDDQSVAVARVETMAQMVRTEVRTIYVDTKTKVMALPPDSVARELNAELAMWRGVESSSGGVDE